MEQPTGSKLEKEYVKAVWPVLLFNLYAKYNMRNAGKNVEWVVMPSSRWSSWPRDQTHISYVSCICRQVLKHRCLLESLRWHIKKQTHHFADKGLYHQSYGFSNCHVWCESWTINKAECWTSDAFELWCWRKLLRVPWTARGTNESVLIEIRVEYSPEGLMLKLKLQYLGHLMWRSDSLEKPWYWERLKSKGERSSRGWGG